ncbi:hypothetical protein D3C80_1059960 [compost metagenome]
MFVDQLVGRHRGHRADDDRGVHPLQRTEAHVHRQLRLKAISHHRRELRLDHPAGALWHDVHQALARRRDAADGVHGHTHHLAGDRGDDGGAVDFELQ